MEGKTWQKCIYLSERICGICSYEHTQTFAETLESISGVQAPIRAQYLRVITNELDRIQSHLLANSTFFKTLDHETLFMHVLALREYAMDSLELLTGNSDHETLFMHVLALREHAMDSLELLTGNRVNLGWNVVGGVRMDADERHFNAILENLKKIEDGFDRHVALFEEAPIVALRAKGVGVMTKEEAIKGHAVGPIGRASGIKHDLREEHYTYKDEFDFKPIWRKEGDNYARTLNRLYEVEQSIDLVKQAIENMPKGDIRTPVDIPSGYGEWRNEAPRGEVRYMAETNGDLIKRISIRTPSIMNIDSCARYMLKDVATVADAVATYASSDPCIACTERVAITDVDTGKSTVKDFFEVK